MKKFLLLFLLFLFYYGCEKKFDSPVETKQAVYQVESVSVFTSFTHTLTDSIIYPSIKFTSSADINKVWIEILSPENEDIISGKIYLYNNVNTNPNVFSTFVTMKNEYINGMYSINYFVEDKTRTTKKVASQTFLFDNGKSNIAPVILSVSAPDTIYVKDAPLAFIINAAVNDSNGVKDIKEVYFITIKPDNTSNGTRWYLFDDGNYTSNGDGIAGDGIFSSLFSIDSNTKIGIYRFDFEAKDRGGLVSQIVRKYIVIK